MRAKRLGWKILGAEMKAVVVLVELFRKTPSLKKEELTFRMFLATNFLLPPLPVGLSLQVANGKQWAYQQLFIPKTRMLPQLI
jgi:hypothetical protein